MSKPAIIATVGVHPSRPERLALIQPDGTVSNWLSRYAGGAKGTVVLALDEASEHRRLTVSGPRALVTDEVVWIADGLARVHGARLHFRLDKEDA
jgi:hypothetical protein